MDCGGGMTARPAGDGGAKELTCRKDRPAEGTARAGTCVCWLEVGGDMPPATGTGRRSLSKNPPPALLVAEPNDPSSATAAGDATTKTGAKSAVRCSAWLGFWVKSGNKEAANGRSDAESAAGEGESASGKPKAGEVTPKVRAATPKARTIPPKVGAYTPKVGLSACKKGLAVGKVGLETPQRGKTAWKLRLSAGEPTRPLQAKLPGAY